MRARYLALTSLLLVSCTDSDDNGSPIAPGTDAGGNASGAGGETGGRANATGGASPATGGQLSTGGNAGVDGGPDSGGVAGSGAGTGGTAVDAGPDASADASTDAGKPIDTMPDPFVIPDLFAVAPLSDLVSGQVTVTGFPGALPVSISGNGAVEVLINGSGGDASTGSVTAGDTLAIRVIAAATMLTIQTITVTVGEFTTTFNVTTGGSCQDIFPGPFTIEDAKNQRPGTLVLYMDRGGVGPTGFACETIVTVRGAPGTTPTVAVWNSGTNSFEPWSTSTTVAPGEEVGVRTAAPALGTSTVVEVTIGGTPGTWTIHSCNAGECMIGDIGTNVGCSSPNTRIVSWRCAPGGPVYEALDFTYQYGGTGLLAAPTGAIDVVTETCGGNGWAIGTLACP